MNFKIWNNWQNQLNFSLPKKCRYLHTKFYLILSYWLVSLYSLKFVLSYNLKWAPLLSSYPTSMCLLIHYICDKDIFLPNIYSRFVDNFVDNDYIYIESLLMYLVILSICLWDVNINLETFFLVWKWSKIWCV